MQLLSASRRWAPLVLIAIGLLACGEREKKDRRRSPGPGSGHRLHGHRPGCSRHLRLRRPGRTFHIVQIRARVDGFLEKRTYTEGAMVRAGQVMFLMDRKPFEAALQQARGSLALADAQRTMVQANLARSGRWPPKMP